MLQSAFAIFGLGDNHQVFLRCKSLTLIFIVLLSFCVFGFGQTPAEKKDEKKPETSAPAKDSKNLSVEQVVESTIVIYAFPGGREKLNQIRKTAFERGRISVTNAEGQTDSATYQRWTLRGEKQNKEKIRLDQEFSSARYSLVHNDEKVFGIFNDSVFTPREDASKAFQNQILHSIETLLRYKENESTLALAGREKHMGVEFYIVDITDKQNRKTRFYISVKSFRVMMLEYEDEGVKFKRKFYNYNYAQGTLVPYRSVLYAGDKIVEETEIGTVTYGQKVDESLFSAS